jgi:hypothetical protein
MAAGLWCIISLHATLPYLQKVARRVCRSWVVAAQRRAVRKPCIDGRRPIRSVPLCHPPCAAWPRCRQAVMSCKQAQDLRRKHKSQRRGRPPGHLSALGLGFRAGSGLCQPPAIASVASTLCARAAVPSASSLRMLLSRMPRNSFGRIQPPVCRRRRDFAVFVARALLSLRLRGPELLPLTIHPLEPLRHRVFRSPSLDDLSRRASHDELPQMSVLS